MSQKKRHLVTAALIYANGPIHIGHLAGCYIPSDLYVRFLRSKGAVSYTHLTLTKTPYV